MKVALLVIIFIVSLLGMSEATNNIVEYYEVVYSDNAAVVIQFIGSLISDVIGL